MFSLFSGTTLFPLRLLLSLEPAGAILVQKTIDDSDARYWSWVDRPKDNSTPPTWAWHAVAPATPCTECKARPDAAMMHNATWHDGSLLSGSFVFRGSSVSIYGVEAFNSGTLTFSLTSGAAPPATTTRLGIRPPTNEYKYNVLFFHTAGLDASEESTVKWAVTNGAPTMASVGIFDYAVVEFEEDLPASSTALTPSPSPGLGRVAGGSSAEEFSSSAASSASVVPLVFNTSLSSSDLLTTHTDSGSPSGSTDPVLSSSPAEERSGTKTSPNRVGVIVGAAVGAILVVALLSGCILWLRRRRRRQTGREVENGVEVNGSRKLRIETRQLRLGRRIDPFVLTKTTGSSAGTGTGSKSKNSASGSPSTAERNNDERASESFAASSATIEERLGRLEEWARELPHSVPPAYCTH
ncbi:hypothetical protein MKEN_00858600 [Mycena kentingensis (nom. inval.)]|nr:hypothetical protein MKEN_00858600 [Mycena kentingensis (nom. inval.)]